MRQPVAVTNNVSPQLQIQAAFQRRNGKIYLDFKFLNTGGRAEVRHEFSHRDSDCSSIRTYTDWLQWRHSVLNLK